MARTNIQPRRADLALWHMLDEKAVQPRDVYLPALAAWEDLARVHPVAFLETLHDAQVLARIFAVEAWDIPVEQVLRTIRLAVGGTIAATRMALRAEAPTLNLLGGFHHAGESSAGGFCAVNDIAVALRAAQSAGFNGTVAIFDLDAHPPDGIADILADEVWIGSLSGADWGDLPESVDETVLPAGAGDDVYLEALDALLARAPDADLVFIIAGGDPLEHDKLGPLKITEAGLLERDARVLRHIQRTPSVWLPGGGYGSGSWRPLAATGLLLAVRRRAPIPPGIDPLQDRFETLSATLGRHDLSNPDDWITEEDLGALMGAPTNRDPRLMGYYTRQGIELAFYRFDLLSQIQRLGYTDIDIDIDRPPLGERLRVTGKGHGQRHLIMETILEKRALETDPDVGQVLFIHWLTLRHPLAIFNAARPKLPGQDAPGLGMAREAGEMMRRMAERLNLPAVALRPAHYHVAYASRYRFEFANPERQGRFEAMRRDFKGSSLMDATTAVDEGRIHLNGEPYAWEADEMVQWVVEEPPVSNDRAERAERIAAERDRSRFTIRPR